MRIFQPTVTGSNTTTGSLHISGPVYFYTLEDTPVSHILVYNTESGQVYYTASSQVGTLTNPAPPSNSIQFNSGGAFGGSSNLTYDSTSNLVSLTGSLHVIYGSSNNYYNLLVTESNGRSYVTIGDTQDFNNHTYLILDDANGTIELRADTALKIHPSTLTETPETNILVWNSGTGEVNYTSSNALIISPFPFTGSAGITGSIELTGSMFTSGAISASFGPNTVGFYGTASWAQSASFATTAAAAPSDTYIQYNKNGVLGAEQHFRYIYSSHSLQNGYNTTASGQYSHAEGFNTIATGSYQTVVGQYNIALPSQSAFIIGDGYIAPLETEKLTSFIAAGADNLSESFSFTPAVGMFIILTDVSTGISETFEITKVTNIGGGNYDIEFNGNTTQTYSNFANDTYSLATYKRHNLLFASRSWFDVSASSVFLRGIPTSSEANILVYNNSTGQVYYTASNALITSPFPYTGSAGITGSIRLTGSMFVSGAISASFGENTVGFYGTASWAQSASFAATAAAAPSDTFIQYNKEGLFGATGSFRFIYTSQSFQQGYNVVASGDYSHAQGSGSTASGAASHAEGWKNIASGDYSHAEGEGNKVLGNGSHVEGRINYISESSRWSHVGGLQNSASGWYQTVFGQNNKPIISQSAFIIGGDSFSFPPSVRWNMFVAVPKTILIDPENSATPSDAIIEMKADTASISASHLFMWGFSSSNSTTRLADSVLTYNSITGQVFYTASNTIGGNSTPAPSDTYIQYNENNTFGAEQYFKYIYTSHSLEQGNNVIASGSYSHAQGSSSLASGIGSHAEGYLTTASGNYSHAEGFKTIASGAYSHAEGNYNRGNKFNIAEGDGSHAEGSGTHAIGIFSHAEGYDTIASGSSTHAEGFETIAEANQSHAEGSGSISRGSYSHAEGNGTITEGEGSHSEGFQTIASGAFSHAEGYNTTAKGYASHAEGGLTLAESSGSHAEGWYTTASGDYSHAEGNNTIAKANYQTVVGEYNVTSSTQGAFIVGDGSNNSSRKNLLFVGGNIIETDTANLRFKNLAESTENYVLTYNTTTDKVTYANAANGYKSYIARFRSENGNPNVAVTELFNNTGATITWENIGTDDYLSISASSGIFTSGRTHWLLNTPATNASTLPRVSFISRSNSSELCIIAKAGTILNYDIGSSPELWGNIEIKIFPELAAVP